MTIIAKLLCVAAVVTALCYLDHTHKNHEQILDLKWRIS